MTPSMLQDALIRHLKTLFAGQTFKSRQGQSALNIFAQNVPLALYDQPENSEGDAYFPYITISIDEWGQDAPGALVSCKLVILAAIYDDGEDLQGHKTLLHILEEIWRDLRQKNIIEDKYKLNYPVTGALSTEDTYPYFFGALETSWTLPGVYSVEGEWENI